MSSSRTSFQRDGSNPTFRRGNIALNKYVLPAATIFILAFCGSLLFIRFALSAHHGESIAAEHIPQSAPLTVDGCNAVCYTKECIKTAAIIMDMMNTSVDPCQDFYTYACGGFKSTPTEHTMKELFLKNLENVAVKFLHDMVKQIPQHVPNNTPGAALTKLRRYYESCIHPSTSEENSLSTALKYLEYFGIKHWPQLDNNFIFSEPNLTEAITRLSYYNLDPFFYIDSFYRMTEDESERLKLLIETSSPPSEPFGEFALQMKFMRDAVYHADGEIKEYKIKISEMVLEFMVENNEDRKQIMEDVLAFDFAINNITQEAYRRTEPCWTDFTACYYLLYDCGAQEDEEMDMWCQILKDFIDASGFSKKNPHTPQVLEDKLYFKAMGELIQATNHSTIAHYFALNFFHDNYVPINFALRRSRSFRSETIERKYYYEMYEDRSTFCALWASHRLPLLAGTEFFLNFYNGSGLRDTVNELYSELKEITLSLVNDIPWIDMEAKTALMEKFSKIRFSVDKYLPYVENATAVDELHKDLQISEDSFLANDLEAKKFRTLLSYNLIDNRTQLTDVTTYQFKFDPTFDPGELIILFGFGTLLFPFVSINRPRYTNLGYFGFVMGHEFGHPVEIFLREYENMSDTFRTTFEERKKCMVESFSKYEIDMIGEKVNGSTTLWENMADYLGIRATVKYLDKYLEIEGPEKKLPGLNLSNKQTLFLISAQAWCEVNTLESLKEYLRDLHSPAKVRITETLKNFDAFSTAFNCSVGTPMNRATKCTFE